MIEISRCLVLFHSELDPVDEGSDFRVDGGRALGAARHDAPGNDTDDLGNARGVLQDQRTARVTLPEKNKK